MLIEWLYTLKEQIDRHGIRLGVVLTLFVMYRKELRNKRLDKRDEAMFHNQKIIMESLGLIDQWHGQAKISHADLMNFKPLQQSYSAAISRVGYLLQRRGSKMNKAWLVTLVTYVLAAAAKKWGITIPDETADWIVDGLIMLIPVALAFMSRTKKEVQVNGPVIHTEDNR